MNRLVFSGLILFSLSMWATPALQEGLSLNTVSLDQALAHVGAGDVIVLGEQHGTTAQPPFQLQVLETLRKNGLKVSLGMEFFEYPGQSFVDQYRAGTLNEASFLKDIKWGQGFPFDSYKQQVLFPKPGEEFVVALNAPMSLTGKIAQSGIAGLDSQDQALMPPNFTLGNPLYKQRFSEVIGDHLPNPQALDNYFAAQCTWDDTMSWKANAFLEAHPDQVLVIIVGEFHVQYGGGLPDRLKARGAKSVTTFSLINLKDLSPAEIQQQLQPTVEYGERANYLWTDSY